MSLNNKWVRYLEKGECGKVEDVIPFTNIDFNRRSIVFVKKNQWAYSEGQKIPDYLPMIDPERLEVKRLNIRGAVIKTTGGITFINDYDGSGKPKMRIFYGDKKCTGSDKHIMKILEEAKRQGYDVVEIDGLCFNMIERNSGERI